jgi:chloramphenicol O-acetyltransferase
MKIRIKNKLAIRIQFVFFKCRQHANPSSSSMFINLASSEKKIWRIKNLYCAQLFIRQCPTSKKKFNFQHYLWSCFYFIYMRRSKRVQPNQNLEFFVSLLWIISFFLRKIWTLLLRSLSNWFLYWSSVYKASPSFCICDTTKEFPIFVLFKFNRKFP